LHHQADFTINDAALALPKSKFIHNPEDHWGPKVSTRFLCSFLHALLTVINTCRLVLLANDREKTIGKTLMLRRLQRTWKLKRQ
jgi:hypothetical protein